MAVNPLAFINPWEVSRKIDARVQADEMYDIKLDEADRRKQIDELRFDSAQLRLDDAQSAFQVNELKRQKEQEDISLALARNDVTRQANFFLQQNPGATRAQAIDTLLLRETDPQKVSVYREMKDREIVSDAQRMLQVGNAQSALALLFDNQMLPGTTKVPTADGTFAYITSDGTPVDPAAVFAAISSGKLTSYMNSQRQAENSRRIAQMQEEGRNARTLATIAGRLGSKEPKTTEEVFNLVNRATEVRTAAYKELDLALKSAEPPASGARPPEVQKILDARVEEARRSALAANEDLAILRRNVAREPQLNEPVSRRGNPASVSQSVAGQAPVTSSLILPAERAASQVSPVQAPVYSPAGIYDGPLEGTSSFGVFP